MEEESNCENFCWIKRILFNKISKKLGWAFGMLIFIIIILVILNYQINQTIQKDAEEIRNIEAPLELMVERVIGYDAILTGNAHWALLHAIENNTQEVLKHKQIYDDTGIKLDNLLKYEAKELLQNSSRSQAEKEVVYGYLEELDKINLALVDLETRAFEAMFRGDVKTAEAFIIGEQYHEYKNQLAELYAKWASEEKRITEIYRKKVISNALNIRIYNVGLGIIFIIIASIIPILISGAIVKPINSLKQATEGIEKGNFKNRVEIKTGDELEELGNTLNKTLGVLERTDDERKQIDKAKTEFLSITSHELRSPMTPMKAQLQMVLGDYFGKLNKEQRESLNIVLNNTERLDKIIVDFLEISRIEAARLKFNFVRADLAKTVHAVIDELKGFMPEKNIKIETHVEKLPTIEVDPDRVS